MSSDDRKQHTRTLQSLIADFRSAENRGLSVDRDQLVQENPDFADSLLDFFAQYDRQRAADTPTMNSGDHPAAPVPTASEDTPTLATTNERVVSANDVDDFSKPSDRIRRFGDYELLSEIARGGMGVVFKARQMNLNRIVALKMILAGQFAGDKDVQRFRTEAESAAQLDHPGIVPIFEIGQHEGQHYFSMSYVEGESLGDRVADGPLSPRMAALLVEKISDAMAYAHGRGVIHRDLKPANVLIDAHGQPKITDFGLAKKTEADSDLTGTGQILGTPAYMPPEQASGKVDEVGPLADVYSIGAILYCLLTGRPPFQAANPMDVLRQVLDSDPIPVRQLVPTIPRDLGTICAKCLNKDPAKRYASAAEMSADLQRHLDDKPILARPASRVERASKWASKQPMIAAILLTMAAWLLGEPKIGVGLLALVAGFHLPFRFRFLRLFTFFLMAVMTAAAVGGLSYLFVWSEDESPGGAARMASIGLLSFCAPAAVVLFVFLFDCVSQLAQPHRRKARLLLLGSAGASLLCIGGFFYYLRDHADQVSLIVDQLADEIVSLAKVTPRDVEQVGSGNAMMQLVRSRTVLWVPVYTGIIWLYLVLGIVLARLIRKFVFVIDGSSKQHRGRQPLQLIKTVDGDVSRWVAITAAVAVAVLPYAVGKLLGIYDIRLMRAFELGNPLDSIVWVIAASWLAASAVVSHRRMLIASGIATLLALWLFSWTAATIAENLQGLGPDGERVSEIVADESLAMTLDGHTGPVKFVDIDHTGKRAVSASGWPDGDGTIRVWNLESGKMLWIRHQSPERMMAVQFTSGGTRLVAGGSEGSIYVWDAETARELMRFQAAAKVEGLALFADDKRCVTAGSKVEVWNLETGELVRELNGANGTQLDVALSSDSNRVATGGMAGQVHVWELESGDKVSHFDLPDMVESLTFSDDDSRLFVALNGSSDEPLLLSVAIDDSKDRKRLRGHKTTVNFVRSSADGRFLVSAARDKTVRIWDAKKMSEIKTIEGHQNWVWSASFTPDGRKILSAGGALATEDPGSDFSLRLWDVGEISPNPIDDSK